MSHVIKENHRLEDASFPEPVAMLQWINGRCAALKDNWELTGIWTGTQDDRSEIWCGLEFTALTNASAA